MNKKHPYFMGAIFSVLILSFFLYGFALSYKQSPVNTNPTLVQLGQEIKTLQATNQQLQAQVQYVTNLNQPQTTSNTQPLFQTMTGAS